MGISDQQVSAFRQVLTYLSWKWVLRVGIAAAVAISLVLGWLVSSDAFSKKDPSNFSKVAKLKVSQEIKETINDVVKRNNQVLGIQVVTVNFQKNIRIETYVSIGNAGLQAVYDHFLNNRVVETALFDENKVTNNRLIRLINGEFVCVPYKDSAAGKYAPAGENFASTVCAIGIPPSYGEFSGIVTLYLKDKPNKELTEQLFLVSRSISLRIYDDNKLGDDPKK